MPVIPAPLRDLFIPGAGGDCSPASAEVQIGVDLSGRRDAVGEDIFPDERIDQLRFSVIELSEENHENLFFAERLFEAVPPLRSETR